MNSESLTSPKLKVAVLHRAVPRWRRPILERLARDERVDLSVYYGRDVEGAKHRSDSGLPRSIFHQLWTIPLHARARSERLTMPLTPWISLRLVKTRPDVVLMEGASNAAMNLMAMPYCLLFRKPFVWWGLGELPGRRRNILQSLFRKVATFPESRSSGIIAYSERSAGYFYSQGISPEKITVATNVVDTDVGTVQDEAGLELARKIRSQHCPPGYTLALFVGTLTAPKRVDNLVQAAAVLDRENIPVQILVVGDGAELDHLRSIVRTANISFVGRKEEDVNSWFRASDFFVLPGLGGLSISHAMAHGLPVIAASADGTEVDLIDHGRSGLLLSTDEVVELSEAMKKLSSDSVLRESMGENALKRIAEQFNIETQSNLIVHRLLASACD